MRRTFLKQTKSKYIFWLGDRIIQHAGAQNLELSTSLYRRNCRTFACFIGCVSAICRKYAFKSLWREGWLGVWEWGSVSNKMIQWRKNTWQDGTRIQDFSYSVQIMIEPISQTILSTSDGINATDSCIFSCSVCQFFYISVKFLLVWMFSSEVTVFTFIRCLISMYKVTRITFGFIK